tara:strand:- start:276 stop:905 length:630 start_codon:yes stop_codon:yes gene_type:complete
MKKEIDQYISEGILLPLMESFYTLQGEGHHKGSAAYFIRIGGCDVGCHWCDVKESWDATKHPPTNIKEIIHNSRQYSKTVVVTGGEPLMWNMGPLTSGLRELNIATHLETSGAYKVTGKWDWFCLSPKKNKLPLEDSYLMANELKVIIYNKNDFAFAEEIAKKINSKCKLFLQPEWSKRELMMPLMVDYVLRNSHWKVSLQTHKYLNIP